VPNSFFDFNQLFETHSFFENTQIATRFGFYLIFTFLINSYSNIFSLALQGQQH